VRRPRCEERCHNVPSPHAGERYNKHSDCFQSDPDKRRSNSPDFQNLRAEAASRAVRCRHPLPVPPPHGGREPCGSRLRNSRNAPAVTSKTCACARGHKRVHARLQRDMHSNVSKAGSPLPRGRTENVAPSVVTYSVVKELVRWMKCESKSKSAPVCGSGPGGRPHSCLFRFPLRRGGWRADKAQCPDYSGRGVRITPDDGCTFVHPRLAARQRGILAFMPLTVVGPGRLLVADEAARVRPGDESCVRPSLAGAAPVPRLHDAS